VITVGNSPLQEKIYSENNTYTNQGVFYDIK